MTFDLPRGYDAWRLAGHEEHHDVGTVDGQPCNRYAEPDEDAPRGYKPKPCGGVMVDDLVGPTCNECGEIS